VRREVVLSEMDRGDDSEGLQVGELKFGPTPVSWFGATTDSDNVVPATSGDAPSPVRRSKATSGDQPTATSPAGPAEKAG